MEKIVEPKSQTDEVFGQSKPLTKPAMSAKVQRNNYNNNSISNNNNNKKSNNNWSNCYTVEMSMLSTLLLGQVSCRTYRYQGGILEHIRLEVTSTARQVGIA